MPELLKNRHNYESLHDLASRIRAVYKLFQVDDFLNDTMDATWDSLELKARMRKIAINLGKYLPTDYEQALGVIDRVVVGYPVGFNDFTLMYSPDFVEVYGQAEQHWELSIAALERYTPLSSSEFAVRSFIINHEVRMMKQMAAWAKHDNEHVRRLASEGCRPQLPWGQALTSFKTDPVPVLTILEQLKADPSLYVRKSVANNLNDISKTHPDLVVKTVKSWYGKNKDTDWVVKHACRTLLKKGNRDVLELFGFVDIDCVKIEDFEMNTAAAAIGEEINFSFTIETKKAAKVRLEYGIDYMKANGKRNRKIFQISEISLNENVKKSYTKTHSFADNSTRKHYSGIHSITLVVNGSEWCTLDFELLAAK